MVARMRSALAWIPAIALAAIVLAGCGVADNHANLPKFMRQADPPPPAPPTPPDAKQLVRDNLAAIFVPSSHPSRIAVSPPRRDPHGPGWIACVKANVEGTSNQPIGVQTYVMFIDNGRIWNRHRADPADGCDAEAYEPL